MMDWNRNGKIDMQDRFITHQIIHDKTDYNHIKNSKNSNSNSKIPAILVAIFVIMCVCAITNGIIVVTFWVADKVYFKEDENSEHIIKNHNYEYNDNYKDDNNYGTSTYDSYNSQQSTQEKNETETEKYSNTTHSNSNDRDALSLISPHLVHSRPASRALDGRARCPSAKATRRCGSHRLDTVALDSH